jgi:hypothetical protein
MERVQLKKTAAEIVAAHVGREELGRVCGPCQDFRCFECKGRCACAHFQKPKLIDESWQQKGPSSCGECGWSGYRNLLAYASDSDELFNPACPACSSHDITLSVRAS